jgi:hypothetical protein
LQTQCARPTGYKLPSELTAISGDCSDNYAVLNPATVWYKDADNDAYSNGATQIQCTRPANHKLASELTAISGDCNDTDPTVNPVQQKFAIIIRMIIVMVHKMKEAVTLAAMLQVSVLPMLQATALHSIGYPFRIPIIGKYGIRERA